MKKDTKGRNLKQNEDQMKDGRYRYRYTDKFGERKAVYSWRLVTTDKTPKGKRDDISLREKEKQIEKDLEEGIRTYEANISVNELFEKYLKTKINLANATKNNYIHLWEKNVKDKIGSIKVNRIKKSDILNFYSYLYLERNFSPHTIQLYQNILFPTFQLAIDDNLIRVNPCRGCMKEYVRGSMSSTKYPLSRQEQNILLDFVYNDNIYSGSYTMIAFMLGTGCRIGETIGLTWDDINFEEKYVSINHQVIYKKKDGRTQYYTSAPKNGESRIIPLQEGIIKILKKHRNNTLFMSMSSGFEVDGYKNFVFLNKAGKIQTPNTIVRTLHGIRDSYNSKEKMNAIEEKRDPVLLPDFTPHTLRHTFCTRMAENGIDVKVLQEIMGHKNISITMQVYNHATTERTKKAMESVAPVLECIV